MCAISENFAKIFIYKSIHLYIIPIKFCTKVLCAKKKKNQNAVEKISIINCYLQNWKVAEVKIVKSINFQFK